MKPGFHNEVQSNLEMAYFGGISKNVYGVHQVSFPYSHHMFVDFLLIMFRFTDDDRNYVDDWCLGKLLQGMCYRCLNKRTEAMECLKSAFSR